jgi:SAM-dependent methyltransferase
VLRRVANLANPEHQVVRKMASDFKPEFFRRLDDSDDELFYMAPRFVVHIDDGAIAKVGAIYAQLLPQGGAILDLMSSWRTHLTEHTRPSRVVGVGLNRDEMDDNPQLTEVVVHNVNANPRLPFDDAQFAGAIMTVSVQYLTRPVETFAEVGRVLKPGAPFIATFSNRMFPTKAVAIWQHLDERDRVDLVTRYFSESGAFEKIATIDKSAPTDPPSDPIWAVVGYRIAEWKPLT